MLRRAGTAGLAAALFLGTGVALAYNDIQGNISQHNIDALLGRDRPSGSAGENLAAPIDRKAGQSLNILVMGSDSRSGENFDNSAVSGMRSDTTMIAHISADRSHVDVVSIPRDMLVEIPSCTLPDGGQTEPRSEAIFNSAFALGGQTGDVGSAAACTIRTVENLTGVYIDDFVVVDFNGFINVVDALDGVPMYIPQAVDDPQAQLDLEAGCQVLDGEEALGFARVRKALGDGSDISRIGRQQELVAAIAREALNKNLLTELPALYRFLDAATSTLTTGEDIGRLPTLAGLATSLRGIGADDIYFATMPFEWAGQRVAPAPEAEEMWEALRSDERIDATLTATGEAPEQEPTETASPDAEDSPQPTEEPTQEPTQDDGVSPEPAPEPTTPACTRELAA